MAEISREEKIIMKMLGEDVEIEPPQSRIEVLLIRLLEQGGGGGGGSSGLVVEVEENDVTLRYTLNKTWNEIKSVIEKGGQVWLHSDFGNFVQWISLLDIEISDGTYYVRDSSWNYAYTCSSPDEYPSYYFG